MKRYHLSTLMLLVAFAAFVFDLPRQAKELARHDVEVEFRFVEMQRMFMIMVAVSGFALVKMSQATTEEKC